ncbi:hypothetical protein CW304_32830 [Bacillus sp. UFRGS-B20]|nr:hypothetical protein CW304_32830 [Bacillus sp. UFRGS-B20]
MRGQRFAVNGVAACTPIWWLRICPLNITQLVAEKFPTNVTNGITAAPAAETCTPAALCADRRDAEGRVGKIWMPCATGKYGDDKAFRQR